MSYSEEKFDVEAILNKRIKKGKVEYRLKWLDYPGKDNAWVPVEMMTCPKLVFDYEKSRFEDIVGVKVVARGIDYVIKMNDKYAFELIPSANAMEFWPDHVVDFLEERIVFEMPEISNENGEATAPEMPNKNGESSAPEIQLTRSIDLVGLPYEIIGCTNFNDELKYLCQWNSVPPALQVVSAQDAKQHFARLVVQFLEPRLVCPPFRYPNEIRFMTREMKKFAESHNISVDSKVKIMRHIGLEKSVMKNAAAKIIDRRVTVNNARTVALKKVTNIPFGVRGRKRQTVNIAFIGLQPNPDGRHLIAGPSRNVASQLGIIGVMPGRRTYSRANSTPLPQTSADSFNLTMSPVASMNTINEEPGSSNETITINYDDSFGRLEYSSDSE